MKPSALDATDLHLLDQLQNDASLSNLELAALVHISPPTCLRRVKRLRDAGLIERQIALLSVDKLQQMAGYGLCAIVEITLDRQDQGALLRTLQATGSGWRVVVEDDHGALFRVAPTGDLAGEG